MCLLALFLACVCVCVSERPVGVSSDFGGPPLLCRPVSLSPAESYVFFISPGCLFVLGCAAPPLAVSLPLVNSGSHHSLPKPRPPSTPFTPPQLPLPLLLPLSWLTATLCFSLCFSWSACLPPEGSSLFPLSAVVGRQRRSWGGGGGRGAEWSTSRQTWPVRENSFCLSVSERARLCVSLSL